ncbi:MAG: bifunctional UDP-N-acetylglucosamine diphosphorylase/glucosamine-1-phosphate N-acetyltransferase GlmU [Coriobacteriales bacterium]|jgi:bifunctional UDP-N-acetylglucosamine pyrophosphorylase/glucosamine-1-phosphate N-acetyltransferase|nr:bifunctional UDP-N-acetylglucosamine diphosphorylase/glucosamine-1-phosphate N-acetyltransferase GlmU [Coriobacteriales bacterium]
MAFATLILAAGAGTRMKSNVPKVAHPLLGKALIRWVIDTVHEAECDTIITVVGHGREQLGFLVDDTISVVQEEQCGTGHAVMMARPHLETLKGTTTLLILCGDTPLFTAHTLKCLVATHEVKGADASVLTFIPRDPTGYGRIVRNAEGGIERIVEQKDANEEERAITEVNSGVYCFQLGALLASLDALSTNNAQGEYYLTDTLEQIRTMGGKVQTCLCADANETLGINDRTQLATATALAQQRINKAHMLAGVTMLDPTSVWIGPDVVIESDVEILPLTMLSGETVVGSGSVIGPNTRITDSKIGSLCVVEESILDNVVLENRVTVGPRAYLRPGTVMRNDSRAGTHVEIKKSDIGVGSKVPHLSYIGDAVLGSEVNVGAGTITCNYDGSAKNKTIIGDRSFIGSDTMFVAPVQVGSDVVTGAGSVITRDVPNDALAVERTEQRIVENWVSRNKKD